MRSQDEDWDGEIPPYISGTQNSQGFESTQGKSVQVLARGLGDLEHMAVPDGMLFGKIPKSRRLPCCLRHTAPSRFPLMIQHSSSAIDMFSGMRMA